jgi:hypothetical protein
VASRTGSSDSSSEPPLKKQRSSLFASYNRRRTSTATSTNVTVRGAVLKYLDVVESQVSSAAHDTDQWLQLKHCPDTSATVGESAVSCGNIRTSGTRFQSEWLDHAAKPS